VREKCPIHDVCVARRGREDPESQSEKNEGVYKQRMIRSTDESSPLRGQTYHWVPRFIEVEFNGKKNQLTLRGKAITRAKRENDVA